MSPSVLFGDVNDFIGFIEPINQRHAEVFWVFSPDEGLAFLVY